MDGNNGRYVINEDNRHLLVQSFRRLFTLFAFREEEC